jgi:hypothetical protein
LLIITRDRHIQDHRADIAALGDIGAEMAALSGREAASSWNQLEVVFTQCRAIEPLADKNGPLRSDPLRTPQHQPHLSSGTTTEVPGLGTRQRQPLRPITHQGTTRAQGTDLHRGAG